MWLCRGIPLGPISAAKSPELGVEVAEPLMRAFEEVSRLAGPIRITKRATARARYRDVRLLLVNMPDKFRADPSSALAAMQTGMYLGQDTINRIGVFAVKLSDRLRLTDWRAQVGGVVETLVYGGQQPEDFAGDAEDVDGALARAGLVTLPEAKLRMAAYWWGYGGNPEWPYMVHADHLHLFTNLDTCRVACDAEDQGRDCVGWFTMPGTYTASFAALTDMGLGFTVSNVPDAWWVTRLLRAGALLVSLTGKVEPAVVTRNVLRDMRKKYVGDLEALANERKMERSELNETLDQLGQVEGFYASAQATPTLMDASVVVGFLGRHKRYGWDPTEHGREAGVELLPMLKKQEQGMSETMIGSRVRANPHLKDIPSQTIAYSGICDLERVGDRGGALLGFTEHDRQPAYIEAMKATDVDVMPILAVLAGTGSGKSMLFAHLAVQWCAERNDHGQRRPVFWFDPKPTSDFSMIADHTFDLSDALKADGAFDPIGFSPNRQIAVELAASTIAAANPFGSDLANWEAPLYAALNYGVEQGADCTLGALNMALRDGKASKDMVAAIMQLQAYPMFRAVAGLKPSGQPLRASEGLTYIRAGDVEFDIAAMAGMQSGDMDLVHRTQIALIRNIVYGSMMALRNRQGVLLQDEAWVLTSISAGVAELDRVGRLARQYQVLPCLATQKVTDLVDAGLAGAISRGLIGPLEDDDQAFAACQLFKLDPGMRVPRLTAGAVLGEADESGEPAFNRNSMRALVVPETREVRRGTVFIYCDAPGRDGKAVPVEVMLPSDLLARISTNRLDRLARQS